MLSPGVNGLLRGWRILIPIASFALLLTLIAPWWGGWESRLERLDAGVVGGAGGTLLTLSA